jgi:NAD-dependent deacetylase
LINPAAGLINYVHNGVPIYLIDPKPVHTPIKVNVIQEKASKGVEILKKELQKNL